MPQAGQADSGEACDETGAGQPEAGEDEVSRLTAVQWCSLVVPAVGVGLLLAVAVSVVVGLLSG